MPSRRILPKIRPRNAIVSRYFAVWRKEVSQEDSCEKTCCTIQTHPVRVRVELVSGSGREEALLSVKGLLDETCNKLLEQSASVDSGLFVAIFVDKLNADAMSQRSACNNKSSLIYRTKKKKIPSELICSNPSSRMWLRRIRTELWCRTASNMLMFPALRRAQR